METPHEQEFDGPTVRVPLFPLPDVVLFPHALLPLHVFEPRYRQMTADVLDGDGCLAIGRMQPGWESLADGVATPVCSMVCLGRIVASEAFPDGRYAIMVQGLTRAAVVLEPESDTPYRIVEIAVQADPSESVDDGSIRTVRRELVSAVRDGYRNAQFRQLLSDLTESSLPAGVVCDIAASALALPSDESQAILAETNVARRCELVIGHLRRRRRTHGRSSPSSEMPGFSEN